MRGAKQWSQPPRRAERAGDKVGINKEKGKMAEAPGSPGGGACLAVGSVEAMDHTTSLAGGGSIRSH